MAASSIATMKRASSATLAVCSPSRAVTSDGRSRQYVTRNSATGELYALDALTAAPRPAAAARSGLGALNQRACAHEHDGRDAQAERGDDAERDALVDVPVGDAGSQRADHGRHAPAQVDEADHG